MPSIAESYILLTVLGLVLASLPVAMLLWRRTPGRQPAGTGHSPATLELSTGVPPPLPVWYSPYQPPDAPLIIMPVQPQRKTMWSGSDAWFALALAVVVSVLLGPATTLLVMATGKAPEEIKIEYTASLFVTQIIFQAGIIGLVVVWLCAVRKFNLVQLFGLKEQSPVMTPVWALVWLVAAYVALIVVSVAILPLMQMLTGMDLKQQGLVENAPDIKDGTTRVLMAITLCVGAPLMEELIFRGVIFSVALRYFHPVYAIVASSLLFGVIHNNLLSLIPLTVLGVFLAESYRRTRTLEVPVLVHSAFNAVSFLLLTYGPPELRQM
jgi:membrane protease YdiL (CAAX protease family)